MSKIGFQAPYSINNRNIQVLMEYNKITFNGSQITLSIRKSPIFIRAVLSFVLVILFLFPLVVTFLVLVFGDGPHVGIAFSYLFFWGIGFYVLRIILWNSFGREILELSPDKISYVADYKYFKDGRKEIGTDELQIEIGLEYTDSDQLGRLQLINGSESIESVLQMDISELEELRRKLLVHYGQSH